MVYVVPCVLAAVEVAVQALLVRALVRVASGVARGALLCIKLLLWAGFFLALGFLGAKTLLIGGAAGATGYLAFAIGWMKRLSREE